MGGKRFRPSEDEVADILNLYKEKHSIDAIANKYRISPTPIENLLRIHNIPTRTTGETKKIVFTEEQISEILEYYKQGQTSREIGRIYGVSHNIVVRTLKEKGVRIRIFKFSKEEQLEICNRYLDGSSMAKIAIEFNTNASVIIYCIRRNKVKSRTVSEARGGIPATHYVEISAAYQSGEGGTSIANRFQVSSGTIYSILRRESVYIRDLSEAQGGVPKDDHKIVVQRYLNGESAYAIAEDYGLSDKAIYTILRVNKVQMRTTGESLKLRTGPWSTRKFTDEEELQIIKEYTLEKKSSEEIAFDKKISANGILGILARNGIQKRSTSESNVLKPFSYGWDSLINITREIPGNFFETQVYIYSIIGHNDILKIGIARDHKVRKNTSDGVYDEMLFHWIFPNRREARIIEAAVLQATKSHFYCPDDLITWGGWSELRRISVENTSELIQHYIDDLAEHCAEGGSIWSWAISHITMTKQEMKLYNSLDNLSSSI
jgi:uncharacterized protein (DUF433 family)/transposase-like protein